MYAPIQLTSYSSSSAFHEFSNILIFRIPPTTSNNSSCVVVFLDAAEVSIANARWMLNGEKTKFVSTDLDSKYCKYKQFSGDHMG